VLELELRMRLGIELAEICFGQTSIRISVLDPYFDIMVILKCKSKGVERKISRRGPIEIPKLRNSTIKLSSVLSVAS